MCFINFKLKLYLQSLTVHHFKNLEQATVAFSPGFNCLIGNNGAGKTNFLDAVYFLCMCKSNFPLTDAQCIQHGENFFRLHATFKTSVEYQQIVVKNPVRQRKIIEKDGIAYEKIADHIGSFPVIFILPDDIKLATEGSEFRRKFVDVALCQTDARYLATLMLYNNSLKQRNSLLKQYADTIPFPIDLLQVYDQQLIQYGQYIFQARKLYLERLMPVFLHNYQLIASHHEEVHLEYQSDLCSNNFSDLLSYHVNKDRALQRTTVGLHKDDLLFFMNGTPLKKFGSQGQLKTFILALKLSQYDLLQVDKQQQPILLLDDIFDKLDQYRVSKLIELLIQKKVGQVFITDTGENRTVDLFSTSNSDYQLFNVDRGKIST